MHLITLHAAAVSSRKDSLKAPISAENPGSKHSNHAVYIRGPQSCLLVAGRLRIGLRLCNGISILAGMKIRIPHSMGAYKRFVRASLVFLFSAYTQAAIVVDESTAHIPVSETATFFRDQTGILRLEDVMRTENVEQFRRLGSQVNFGFTDDAIWARFEIRSNLSRDSRWLLILGNPRTQNVDWYVVRENGRVEHKRMGMLMDYAPGQPRMIDLAFDLALDKGELLTVFVRCRTDTAFMFKLSLHDPVYYSEQEIGSSFWLIFLFGCLGILFVMALLFSIYSREPGYLTYAASVATASLLYWSFTGYWRWMEWPLWRFWTYRGLVWIFQSTLIASLLAQRDFLSIRRTSPRLDRFVVWLAACYAVLIPVCLLGPFRFWIQFVQVQTVATGFLCLGIAARYALKGNTTARIYFFSWVQFWLFALLQILANFGFLTVPFSVQYLGVAGLVGAYTLFFIAMAYRVRQLRLEREREREGYYQGIEMLMRDLHDGVGGIVAGIGMLGEIGRRAGDVKGKDGYLRRICDLAAVGNAEVRSLIGTLESRDMNWPDLITELRRYGETLLENHDIAFEMKFGGVPPSAGPGLMAGMSLFRIFKEALNNVIKHSGATEVDAELSFSAEGMRLVVLDNGGGMDGAAVPSTGHGLRNMRKRIEEFGGVMSIADAKGCRLTFQAPIPLRSPDRGIDVTHRAG